MLPEAEVSNFCAFMNGFCSFFEDLPDGAYIAACETGVEAWNVEYPQFKIEPNDGFLLWVEQTCKREN